LHPRCQILLSRNNFTDATLDNNGLKFEIAPQSPDITTCDPHVTFTHNHSAKGNLAGVDCELLSQPISATMTPSPPDSWLCSIILAEALA
jgi:hypothetical protein